MGNTDPFTRRLALSDGSSAGATVCRIGRLEVFALLDAVGSFGEHWGEVFAGATEADWSAARTLEPAAFGGDGTWVLRFCCFAVRRPAGGVTLVDTGVGPQGAPAASWAPVPGLLPEALHRVGIAAGEIDTVVLTHLHSDHVGGALDIDGVPAFPNAEYLVQATEIGHLADSEDRTMWEYLQPLVGTGQLRAIDGRTRLHSMHPNWGASVTAVPTPGHTPGHQSLLVEGGQDQIVIAGDALVHAVQLNNPDVVYRFEHDPAVAAQTRQQMFLEARRKHALLASAHLHTPFLRIASAADLPRRQPRSSI